MSLQNVLTTDNCRYCLMCRHVCPVGYVTRLETLTPHGWGLTIASVQRGLLAWNDETVSVLYACADCGLCRANCATDQPLPDAIAAARAQVVTDQVAPTMVYEIGEMLKSFGNPYMKETSERSTGTGELALFVGDEAQYLWPDGVAAARILVRATGATPVEIGVGRNNGYLASSLGFPDTARELVQTTLDELRTSGARKLLVLSPGDYYAFTQHLDRLGLVWPEEVELIELTAYLHSHLNAGLKFRVSDDTTPYTYVDPTHAARVSDRREGPRALLASVLPTPARELFWREGRAHPVGSTALQFTHPQIADRLTFSRLEDAVKSGARVLVSEDAGTLHQLNRFAREFGIQVKGLYELLAEQL